ncbi:helix-turn-helix transcriptional regulator [Pseudoalteromonas sp. T1lg22]|uniref:helix-turn-helix transcriptional regulator n=1 Tax=Pseudoalteromonas sp. T1lg22 TaxID=2077096 RepID=UPI000CF72548|nr:sigma factor-like helix-turn-helix DNA-binding protein [Pseudoalteromonas sp. T1lg22]
MQTTRTATGYQLEDIQVDTKPFSSLPTQQARTLLFVAQGLPQKRIAEAMGVKVSTVKKACSDLGFRFNTHTMRETVHQAVKQGVLRYTLCLLLCLLSTANGDLERSFRTVRNNRTVRTTRVRRLRELQNDLLAA